MEGLVWALLISLLLTEALELAFCAAVWRMRGRELAVCALVNVVTNPPVVLLHTLIKQSLVRAGAQSAMPLVILALELAAVTVEWLFYRRCTDIKRPFAVSLTANAFSYGMGLLISLFL